MKRLALVFSLVAAVAACTKKKEEGTASGSATTTTTTTTTVTTGSGSGSGSDLAMGSGSAGSGSDVAAGSGSAADAGSAAGSAAGSGSDVAAVDFDKLSHDDQIKFMKTKVVPPMKAAFQKFDPKAFANFGCKTCHGKDPQKAKYKMPSPDIPALDFEALKRGEDKEVAEFMSKTVKPEMAKILGKPEMTEQNHDGFGCLACHTQKKKKG